MATKRKSKRRHPFGSLLDLLETFGRQQYRTGWVARDGAAHKDTEYEKAKSTEALKGIYKLLGVEFPETPAAG